MGNLTKYEALLGELEPYTPSALTLKKALSDAGVSGLNDEYAAESDKRTIALAAINVLKKMIVLTSDSLGKSSQGYSVAQLEKRIKDLCAENGLDASEFVEIPSITDGSNMW
jgi:phosphopantetheine adenylyltransferase